ncbi:uncharacterized protein LOC127079425 [Lathyrus oleraceus]|uniref:uncharacterized protein LOC127079425 n=1 Tax=Pisum sativum TaxID=3888 RepID=UPI0021CF09FB|nr:uncharacterized protein LOC127079425 [Pisum sativum]
MIRDKDGKITEELKPEEDWDDDDDKLADGNSKDLNALFNVVDKNIFKLIINYIVSKYVKEILKTSHEGISKVKMSRLQILTTKFENLRMKEDESIHDFHMNIIEIANVSSALGEKMSEAKLVRKILRFLPKRFDMKVTAIEEAQAINNMKVDELMGSLQTFELGISEKSLAEGPKLKKKPTKEKEYNAMDVKGLVTALIRICDSDEDSDCEKLTFKDLAESYKELCLRNEEVCKLGEDQKKTIAQLQAEKVEHLSIISVLKEEVVLLNSRIDNMTKSVRMLNNSSDVLDEILQTGKNAGNVQGLGYGYQGGMNKGKGPAMNFVLPKGELKQHMSN